jgi:hypothetical protein
VRGEEEGAGGIVPKLLNIIPRCRLVDFDTIYFCKCASAFEANTACPSSGR